MADFTIAARDQKWIDKARALVPHFRERARKYDEAGQWPSENIDTLVDEGFLKLAVPREYGGLGTSATYCSFLPHAIVETVASGCASTGWGLLTQYHCAGLIGELGSEEQKRRIFSDVVQNGALMASVGSEVMPEQMKAAANTKLRIASAAGLTPVAGGFQTTATKGFCSGAPVSKYLLYWALAPGCDDFATGIVVSIVPADSPGVSFLPGWEEAIGIRGSLSGGAKLENVFIPWRNVMGQPGDYVQKHRYTFELTYAVQLLGIAQGAFDFVTGTLKERVFLMSDDVVAYAVGDMSSALQATRSSWLYAQWLWDQGRLDEAAQATMCALHQAKSTAMMVTTKAFEVIGVRALFKFNPLERALRDARTVSLHTRESQLMRLLADGEVTGNRFVKEKYGKRIEQPDRRGWSDLGLGNSQDAASA